MTLRKATPQEAETLWNIRNQKGVVPDFFEQMWMLEIQERLPLLLLVRGVVHRV